MAQVSRLLGIKPQRLDVEQPLARYSLDSIIAIELTEELERWLGRKVPETLFWDEPGIRDIARFLCGEKAAAEFDSAPPVLSVSSDEQSARPQPPTVEPIAIIGLGCRVPAMPQASGGCCAPGWMPSARSPSIDGTPWHCTTRTRRPRAK